MFGFASEDEVLQLKPEDLNALYDMTNTRSDVLRQIENHGNIRNKEVLFRKKDGSRFWGLESCYLHLDEAGRKFIDGIIVDITPIKESENLLREKNHELQKVNEEMDRFVYSVSHDLRAPLSSVLGLLNLAEMETDPAQLSLFIQMMKKSVKKLDHFINEILDYSRNARLKLEDDRVDLETLTTEIIKSIEYMDGFERIRKSVKVYSRSEFVSDKKRIKIVLTNLITNAVLYHDSKKQNQFIEINAFIENESARIEVIDNGRGIQTTHLDKIFKMFYRASEDSKGSGLGLFMVKECVEKLEGTLNVSSTYGIGTKFEIVLKNFLANTARQSRLFGTSASA
jgi:PAS domain S-box-containing protein